MAQTLQAVIVQGGERLIDYTPRGNLAAGEVVDLGGCVGITMHPIAADELGALAIDAVADFLKYADEEIALWAEVYWDDGTNTATATVAYSEGVIGKCVKAAAAGDATVRVLMIPVSG